MSKRRSEPSETEQPSPSKQQYSANNVYESGKVLRELSMLFPVDRFQKRVPRVVMKHMVYSRIQNRTKVDKEIVDGNILF